MEDERWLMMAVLDHLQKVGRRGDVSDEPIQEAMFALANAYSLNIHNSATKERYPLDGLSLTEIFKAGRAQLLGKAANDVSPNANATPANDAIDVESSSAMAKDPVFTKFLVKLKETTTFFKDVEEGSSEYNKRVSHAWEKYQQKRTEKKKRASGNAAVADSAGASSSAPRESQNASAAEAAKLKEEGNAAVKAKDYQKAVELYTRCIELDGQNAVYYSNRAAAKVSLSLYSEAVEDCKQAIALDPGFVRPRERLALSYRYLGMTENEIDALKEAVRLAPHNESFAAQLRDAEARLASGSSGGQRPRSTGGGGPGLGGLESLLGSADPTMLTSMGRAMGLNVPDGAVESFLNSGAADQIGSMMRDNPGIMQQAMQAMMGGGMPGMGGGMPGMGGGTPGSEGTGDNNTNGNTNGGGGRG